MTLLLRGISSMATRDVLADLAGAYRRRSGAEVTFESVGGVDAARRIEAGEPFDLVVLAADAIDKLVAAGRVVAGSRADLVRSEVAIAVRDGAPPPDVLTSCAWWVRKSSSRIRVNRSPMIAVGRPDVLISSRNVCQCVPGCQW